MVTSQRRPWAGSIHARHGCARPKCQLTGVNKVVRAPSRKSAGFWQNLCWTPVRDRLTLLVRARN